MTHLVCTQCGDRYPASEPRWKCECGALLDLEFTPRFDRQRIVSRPPSMWRYREALPIERDEAILTFGEGFTPLAPFRIGGRDVLVKQDQLFPTGSFKDRGAAVLISKARELGVRQVVEDSSGNAGCAIAAWSARAGITCEIYVPASTSPAKTAQIELYGARLVRVSGSREDTARAVLQAANTTYYASHSWNPFFFHGAKTWAFEVWEQLGWRAPDAVVLPVGNGTLLLGASLGFRELLAAGQIERLPRIIAVQSERCAPLAQAFSRHSATPVSIEKQDTLAEGIAIAEPVRGEQILSAVRDSAGAFLTVSEAEIETSLIEMAHQGAYIEPTAAAAIAGAAQYGQQAPANELVVTVFTGHGLKSTEKILKIL
ncbi:MAG TPA: threonine synthase [Anaerolineaceae bacterium]|nr:threonine synthase [Anaerolineaceae bacterium]